MSDSANMGAGVKYFVAGMLVLLVIVKPKILTGIANGIEDQPIQPVAVSEDDPSFRKFEHIITRIEELIARTGSTTEVVQEQVLPPQNEVTHPSDKVAAFEAALAEQRQKELEVQYSGDDPIVRQRVGLNPKRLTTIEEFDYPGEEIVSIEKFDQAFKQNFSR